MFLKWLTEIGIASLAYLLKYACPWYLRQQFADLMRHDVLPTLFLVSVTWALVLALPVQLPRVALRRNDFLSSPPAFDFPDEETPREPVAASLFPTPAELTQHVAFWKAVFTRYSCRQMIVYDSWYPQVVYAVIDLDTTPDVTATLQTYRRLLRALARKAPITAATPLSDEERRLVGLFAEISEPQKFHKAATERIRLQRGQREYFRDAVRLSGQYQPRFEAIFRQHGLPLELTRLPFVESYFQERAYSSAGAAGIWQFMPATARLYGLALNRRVDERYDAFKSADSAARLLKANYAIFQSWPLAVTAYNHGPAGLLRAINTLKTQDLGIIARAYRDARFGFYSRNYYAQFVAVVEIMAEYPRYFDAVM